MFLLLSFHCGGLSTVDTAGPPRNLYALPTHMLASLFLTDEAPPHVVASGDLSVRAAILSLFLPTYPHFRQERALHGFLGPRAPPPPLKGQPFRPTMQWTSRLLMWTRFSESVLRWQLLCDRFSFCNQDVLASSHVDLIFTRSPGLMEMFQWTLCARIEYPNS